MVKWPNSRGLSQARRHCGHRDTCTVCLLHLFLAAFWFPRLELLWQLSRVTAAKSLVNERRWQAIFNTRSLAGLLGTGAHHRCNCTQFFSQFCYPTSGVQVLLAQFMQHFGTHPHLQSRIQHQLVFSGLPGGHCGPETERRCAPCLFCVLFHASFKSDGLLRSFAIFFRLLFCSPTRIQHSKKKAYIGYEVGTTNAFYSWVPVWRDHNIVPKIVENGDNYSAAPWRNIMVGVSKNGLPTSCFRDKWQIYDGKRKVCFSPAESSVTFLPVQKNFVPAGPKCDVFREARDKKSHKLKKKNFVCESVTFFSQTWQTWSQTWFGALSQCVEWEEG